MKFKLLLSLPLVGCIALVSCYPIPDKPRGPRGAQAEVTVTSDDQQKIQEQRDRMKETEEKEKEMADLPKETPRNETVTDKPATQKKGEYVFANPVPGKEGFVFSPFNNKLINVQGIPSGTLVEDPTYPEPERATKRFRVP